MLLAGMGELEDYRQEQMDKAMDEAKAGKRPSRKDRPKKALQTKDWKKMTPQEYEAYVATQEIL